MITQAQIDACKRAYELGRSVLKIGDKICAKVCGGGRSNFRIFKFDGDYIYSKTGACTTAASIIRVNGERVSFYEEPEE